MTPSLSVILPVYNAQGHLSRAVSQWLEILVDLTGNLELLIVDNGSTDHTCEVSADLVQQYPQVRMTRHALRQDLTAAIQAGIQLTTGQIILVGDVRAPLSPQALRQLWEMRHDNELVVARSTPAAMGSRLIRKLVSWGSARARPDDIDGGIGSVQMIRRSAVQELGAQPVRHVPFRVDRVTRTDLASANTQAPKLANLLAGLRAFVIEE